MTKRIAISKRTRFEVLKRDNLTCQYCGAKAPDAILEIDHVKPVAGGGCGCLSNLKTACVDCNRGKGVTILHRNSEEALDEVYLKAFAIQKRFQDWFSDKFISLSIDIVVSLLTGRTEESIIRQLEQCNPASERDRDMLIGSIQDDLVRYIDQAEGVI